MKPKSKEDVKNLIIALARAAWALADGTEGTVEKDDRGEKFLRVPEDLFNDLCKSLDDLDNLPELPSPYIGTGPAKAEYALGLDDLVK